jgi:hypothetical protein
MKIRAYQERVYNWQRDVAAQPVTKTPTQRDPEFCKKQLGFAKSEWFEEYLPNASDYADALGQIDEINLTSNLRKIDRCRFKIADDIGDVAFTILGLLNAYGVTLDNISFSRTTDLNLIALESRISEFLEKTERSDSVSDSAAKSAFLDLIAISTYYAINFWSSLQAVCISNDTKLWKLTEVHDNELKIESLKWTVTKVAGLCDDRCFRVKNPDGKLMKSPSFTEPDLRAAVMQFVDLT